MSIPKGPLREGEDFILEHGLMVLTAEFLRKRGYCCQSGCRNCPYSGNEEITSEAPR
ncbi:MAG: hypothetical protein IPJ06_08965 [Saprospiraceae bacterium]|nr:hypothetical protein [Saprospiraceae bacterium]